MTASAGVAAAGLAGAIAWTAAGSLGAQAPHIASLAADLDAKVREASAGVRARAETLAQLPRLEVAVATDMQTIRDLTADELAFRPHPGELIEIAQVPRPGGPAGNEGPARTMLRFPARGPDLPMGDSGSKLQIWQGELHVAAVVPVEPRERARELRGAVAVDQTVDLSSFASRLAALGLGARVQIGANALSLGGMSRETGGTAAMELGSGANQVKLILEGLPPPPSRVRFLGPFALAIVSAGAAQIMKRRRTVVVETIPAPTAASDHTAPVALPATPRGLALLSAVPTEPVEDAANATVPMVGPGEYIPAPVVDATSDITAPQSGTPGLAAPHSAGRPARADEEEYDGTIPSSLFEAGIGPPPLALPKDQLDREYRALFDEFVKLRRSCREPTDNLDADRFVHALRAMREELARTQAPDQLTFRLAFHNGRAAVRLPPGPKST